MKKLITIFLILFFASVALGQDIIVAKKKSDTTPPTLISATIATNGTTFTIVWSENTYQGAGYNDADLDVDCTLAGNGVTLTYVSGNGTGTHIYTLGTVLTKNDICNLDFNGDANSLEDASGNDVAAISSGAITNNSTQYNPGFATDANLKALWRFENGALTTDSKGTNTLTDNNTVGTDTVNFKEGAASADLELGNAEYFSITDANLDAGFPLKNGDATKKISVCTWVKFESLTGVTPIYLKHDSNNDKRSFALVAADDTGYKIRLSLGYNNGADAEQHFHATVLSTATWYHITASYQNSDKAYAIRIRDTNGGVVGSDLTGPADFEGGSYTFNVEDAPVWIGYWYDSPDYLYFDGLMDEMVVFNDIITANEATAIAKGIYQ